MYRLAGGWRLLPTIQHNMQQLHHQRYNLVRESFSSLVVIFSGVLMETTFTEIVMVCFTDKDGSWSMLTMFDTSWNSSWLELFVLDHPDEHLSQEWPLCVSWLELFVLDHPHEHLSQEWPLYVSLPVTFHALQKQQNLVWPCDITLLVGEKLCRVM